MAKVLESYDFDRLQWRFYPWTEWMDGRTFEVHHHKDFHCNPMYFTHQLARRARLNNMRVRHHWDGNGTVVFQFLKPEATETDVHSNMSRATVESREAKRKLAASKN